MEFFRIRKDIPFMRYALVFNIISLITFVLAVVFLVTRGLHLGVEFTGGTVMEVGYSQAVDVQRLRGVVEKAGYPDATVQTFGSSQTALIRLPSKPKVSGADISKAVLGALTADDPGVQLRRVDFVGSQVGRELVENGLIAIALVALGIVLYLWLRFEWKFGVAAIIANLHDVVIILGFFALFQWEFSLPVLAAVLAVLGYSVNESVVVFDRVRENFRKMRKATVPEGHQQRHHEHDLADDHHPRLHAAHGDVDPVLRWRHAVLLRAGAHHRDSVRHLLVGARGKPLVMYLGIKREDLVKPERKREEAVV